MSRWIAALWSAALWSAVWVCLGAWSEARATDRCASEWQAWRADESGPFSCKSVAAAERARQLGAAALRTGAGPVAARHLDEAWRLGCTSSAGLRCDAIRVDRDTARLDAATSWLEAGGVLQAGELVAQVQASSPALVGAWPDGDELASALCRAAYFEEHGEPRDPDRARELYMTCLDISRSEQDAAFARRGLSRIEGQ